ncbi:Tumor necrosis factor receptor superfamily member 14 [Galemys pyrenaicus]|uniref:Tumor necrosis factor receptor superfamily member 14 n=1 Tax=Galemys pyrenaicus TaxID=202257 RepID=A0A8J5ZUQ4_GALPY|nr:Tumor necrosis factor receptor superfamily member 14 [Galemys pyrenaicus]
MTGTERPPCPRALGSPPCALSEGLCEEDQHLGPVLPQLPPSPVAAGHRVQRACGEHTDTTCVPCTPGTFTAHPNGLSQCLPCRDCDPAESLLPPVWDPAWSRRVPTACATRALRHTRPSPRAALGLETRRGCQTTGDTQCGCAPGHVCVEAAGDSCMQCRPHATCSPGQRVRQRGSERQDTLCEDCPPGTFSPDGTLEQCQPHVACSPGQRVRQRAAPCLAGNERQDTLCEDCPPGTFSPNGTLEQCQPWTRCSGLEKEASPGTGSSDVTCSSQALYLTRVRPEGAAPKAAAGCPFTSLRPGAGFHTAGRGLGWVGRLGPTPPPGTPHPSQTAPSAPQGPDRASSSCASLAPQARPVLSPPVPAWDRGGRHAPPWSISCSSSCHLPTLGSRGGMEASGHDTWLAMELGLGQHWDMSLCGAYSLVPRLMAMWLLSPGCAPVTRPC